MVMVGPRKMADPGREPAVIASPQQVAWRVIPALQVAWAREGLWLYLQAQSTEKLSSSVHWSCVAEPGAFPWALLGSAPWGAPTE